MNKLLFFKWFPYILVPIAIYTIESAAIFPIGNTFIWWAVQMAIIIMLWLIKDFVYDKSQSHSMLFVQLYLFWIGFSFFHGILMSEIYWDWKALISNSMALFIIFIAYVATNETAIQVWLSNYLKFALPLFFLFAPFIYRSSFGEYLMPVSFLIFFFPVLPIRNKLLIVVFAFIVLTATLEARSVIIKFSLPILFLAVYFSRKWLPSLAMEIIRIIFLFLPFVLLILALSGIFNPFALEENVGSEVKSEVVTREGERREENLTADTRTFLYVEVLTSAQRHNSWIIGRSPARGNDTEAFGDWTELTTGRRERVGNEASILNVFNWLGIVGMLLYFAVFWSASYMAVHNSNNIFIKMIGLFVAFRWAYAWVEDYNDFNLNNVMLFIMMGMCYSKSFRAMTDMEVTIWVRGIFDKRYRQLKSVEESESSRSLT